MTATTERTPALGDACLEHDLKTWPEAFAAVRALLKPWELRLDDRGYQVGDILNLREWDNHAERYSGETERRIVTWLLRGPAFGLPDGYVIMSMKPYPDHAPKLLEGEAVAWSDAVIDEHLAHLRRKGDDASCMVIEYLRARAPIEAGLREKVEVVGYGWRPLGMGYKVVGKTVEHPYSADELVRLSDVLSALQSEGVGG